MALRAESEVEVVRHAPISFPALLTVLMCGGALAAEPVGDEASPEASVPAAVTPESSVAADGIVVAPRDIQWRVQPFPAYPRAGLGVGAVEERCTVQVVVSAEGVPSDIRVSGCQELFGTTAAESVAQWRAHPHREDGVAVPFQTTMTVRFIAPGSAAPAAPPAPVSQLRAARDLLTSPRLAATTFAISTWLLDHADCPEDEGDATRVQSVPSAAELAKRVGQPTGKVSSVLTLLDATDVVRLADGAATVLDPVALKALAAR